MGRDGKRVGEGRGYSADKLFYMVCNHYYCRLYLFFLNHELHELNEFIFRLLFRISRIKMLAFFKLEKLANAELKVRLISEIRG